MFADRTLPTKESADFVSAIREYSGSLSARVSPDEAAEAFPRDVFRQLGAMGMLGLAFDEEYGGGGQPYEVYLQALEEIAAVWASVAVGVSVHALSCFGLAAFGTAEQKALWLPDMLGGHLLGAYCLSESHAGSDPAAMRARAVRSEDGYIISGSKAWTTHGGHADFYQTMVRTGEQRGDISCFLVPSNSSGLSASPPERKMGLTSSPTATMLFEDVHVPELRRLAGEGEGLKIALAGLDAGRLGIAAVATGLAQAALDCALAYAQQRETFGRRIIDHQGVAFMLADMVIAVETSRSTYLEAARRRDAHMPYSFHASIAKTVATDSAMRVTTDAVQVLGAAGYTEDFTAERFMREAKVMQIFEGTNQIQRLVIGRVLDRGETGAIRVRVRT